MSLADPEKITRMPSRPAIIIPLKGGPLSKSRLGGTAAWRRALSMAMAEDTLAAVRAGLPDAAVFVVTLDPATRAWASSRGAGVVADPGSGLDAASAAGLAAAEEAGARVRGVLFADHPALRPREIREALAQARHTPIVVPDHDGEGTALLAGPGALPTAFGAGSAAAHEALGHLRVEGSWPGLRLDVDDATDLERARMLGVGPATAAALAGYPAAMQATISVMDDDGSGRALLDDGREVVVPPESLARSALRRLRPGQRVSIELLPLVPLRASRVWIVGIGQGETIR